MTYDQKQALASLKRKAAAAELISKSLDAVEDLTADERADVLMGLAAHAAAARVFASLEHDPDETEEEEGA